MHCQCCHRKVIGYMVVDQYQVSSYLSGGLYCLYGEPIYDMVDKTFKQALVQCQNY